MIIRSALIGSFYAHCSFYKNIQFIKTKKKKKIVHHYIQKYVCKYNIQPPKLKVAGG